MGERYRGEVPSTEDQPARSKRTLTGPKRQPHHEIGPDGTVRGVKSVDDAKDLGEERREAAREQQGEQ